MKTKTIHLALVLAATLAGVWPVKSAVTNSIAGVYILETVNGEKLSAAVTHEGNPLKIRSGLPISWGQVSIFNISQRASVFSCPDLTPMASRECGNRRRAPCTARLTPPACRPNADE